MNDKNNSHLKHQDFVDLKKRIESIGVVGLDAEIYSKGLEMSAYFIQSGSVKFLDFSHKMLQDVGNCIRPYLKSLYSGIRYCPGMESFSDEMSTPDFVDRVDLKLIKIDDKFYRQLWCHAMGLWHASEYIEKGCYSIESIARLMIKDFGDVIRPQIVPCYEQSREWYKHHGHKDVLARMDPPELVKGFDADTFDKPVVDEECFYAPMEPGFLTIAMHPGVLNKYDILENIVLIGMMSEQEERGEEISVEEALRRREDLSVQELMSLAGREQSCWRDPAWTHVWKAYGLDPEEATSPDGEKIPLYPIEVAFAENGERLSKSEAMARMIEMMENSYLERFWERTPEWDHAGPE